MGVSSSSSSSVEFPGKSKPDYSVRHLNKQVVVVIVKGFGFFLPWECGGGGGGGGRLDGEGVSELKEMHSSIL